MGWDISEVFGGGDVLDMAAGWFGQKEQNRANTRQSKDMMDFQQRNSDTSYQRAMADLKEAGINPILAGQFGGASSPAGAMAQMGNEIGAGLSNVQSMKRTDADTKNTKAKTVLAKMDAIIKNPQLISAKTQSIINQTILDGLTLMHSTGKNKPLNAEMRQKISSIIQKALHNIPQFNRNLMKHVIKNSPSGAKAGAPKLLQDIINNLPKGQK